MDRNMEVRHLAQADVHLERAERIITRQLELIEQLEQNGHNLSAAISQLRRFEDVRDGMSAHRATILSMIQQIDDGLA